MSGGRKESREGEREGGKKEGREGGSVRGRKEGRDGVGTEGREGSDQSGLSGAGRQLVCWLCVVSTPAAIS